MATSTLLLVSSGVMAVGAVSSNRRSAIRGTGLTVEEAHLCLLCAVVMVLVSPSVVDG